MTVMVGIGSLIALACGCFLQPLSNSNVVANSNNVSDQSPIVRLPAWFSCLKNEIKISVKESLCISKLKKFVSNNWFSLILLFKSLTINFAEWFLIK